MTPRPRPRGGQPDPTAAARLEGGAFHGMTVSVQLDEDGLPPAAIGCGGETFDRVDRACAGLTYRMRG